MLDRADHQAEAVRALLGCGVRAIVWVHGSGVEAERWFSKPIVDGVRFGSGRRLADVIRRCSRFPAGRRPGPA